MNSPPAKFDLEDANMQQQVPFTSSLRLQPSHRRGKLKLSWCHHYRYRVMRTTDTPLHLIVSISSKTNQRKD